MNVKVALLVLMAFLNSQQSASSPYQRPAIQQGDVYQKRKNLVSNISQYYISEKLDGMRAYWDGKQLLSRQGNIINSPAWFTQTWPNAHLDGELWIAPDSFQELMSCVKKKIAGSCWLKVSFMVFDLPKHSGRFSERVKQMKALTGQGTSPYLKMIRQFKVANLTELDIKLEQVINNKGEGLMLHLASAYYHVGRTSNLLKLKKHQDSEAVVIEHIEGKGKGKYQHMLGAIKVRTNEGIVFKLGSGFSDLERANPPAIGTTITYKYNGLTKAGKPRFARYWRIRKPVEVAKY